jgi:endogenous inhibitor of DNA gyrase (YacG/DUF329 family)
VAKKCPICKRALPADTKDLPLPFCGQRCKLADLGSWLSGRYVVSDALPWDDGEEQQPLADGRDERDE